MSEKTSVGIRFNKLRGRLPHRYTKLVAKKAEKITPTQVKLVFEGRIANPEVVEAVYNAAQKVAALYAKTLKLHPKKYRKTVKQ